MFCGEIGAGAAEGGNRRGRDTANSGEEQGATESEVSDGRRKSREGGS